MLLEEMVVTAEKQASGRPLQIVPIAITAVDAATLQDNHIQNIVDIGHMAPNVILDPSGTLMGTAAFTIRGVGERSSTASIDPAVSVTQDGMVVQPGIAIPANTLTVTINAQGQVNATVAGNTTPQTVGQLELTRFPNEAGLNGIGGNLYLETPASGSPQAGVPGRTRFV